MSSDSAKRLMLVGSSDVILKCFGSEDAVVAVNMLDGYIVPFRKGFETNFGLQGGLGCGVFLTVSVQEAGKMVDPHSNRSVTALGWATACKRDEAQTASHHLIDGNKITGLLGITAQRTCV
jgi:hypothetical protein